MKLGAVNDFRKDLCDEIRFIADSGFDFIDLTLEPTFSNNLKIKEVKKEIKETGLEVIGHTSPFLPFVFPLKSVTDVCMDEFKLYIDLFAYLEVKLMNIHPSILRTLIPENDLFEKNREFIGKINDICRRRGITLMIENFIKPFNTPESFKRLLDGLDDIKVHLDTGHCNIRTERNLTEEFFQTYGDRIVHVHFSDNTGGSDQHLPLGCGNINWKQMVAILRKYGYDSTITLEIFSNDRRYLLYSKKLLEEILAE